MKGIRGVYGVESVLMFGRHKTRRNGSLEGDWGGEGGCGRLEERERKSERGNGREEPRNIKCMRVGVSLF